jgi:PAS domain S-box-containing protein
MADLPQSKFIAGLASLASSGITRDEMAKYFTGLVKDSFGIEKVAIRDVASSESGSAVGGQVLSTRKHFVDNNLSEYSLFPELIGYSNDGYRSYAAIPIMADGKVVSLLEMLSSTENRFTPDLIDGIALGALLIGFALAYKSEHSRSSRLAGYFDAVFNSDNPQILVSSGGAIVKANKVAVKSFKIQTSSDIKSALGVDYNSVLSMASARSQSFITVREDAAERTYSASVSRAGDTLLYLSLQDVSDMASLRNALQSITQSDDALIVFTDQQMNIIGTTENFERILGHNKNITIGKSVSDLVSDKQRDGFETTIRSEKERAARTGKADVLTLSGYPIRMRFSAARSLNGYAIMFVKADAEKYVQDLREGLDDFIANASEIVIRVDRMGYITGCNLSTESTLGYRRDDMVGKDIRSIYKDQSIVDRDMAYARNLGKPDNSYVDLVNKNGDTVPGTQSIRLLTDPDGNSEYIVVIRELLTKRTLEDRELTLTKKETEMKRLRSTGELKSQFIYNISHELKTPLTNIKGFAKLLHGGEFGQLNDEQKQYMQTISDEADRLMLIIQQVLDSAKLDAQKVKLELKEVDMNSLKDNPSIVALKESAEEKGLTFSWKVDFDVPTIHADPNRIIQVFVNLIGNSIKFTETGGIKVHISKKLRSKIECSVEDTGIGISEEDRKKLFKKFYQVPTKKGLVTQNGAGTGLGLSITKELVKLHGGEISFESQPGRGARFWFTLRVNPKSAKQRPQQ